MESTGLLLDCTFQEGLGVTLSNDAPNKLEGTISGANWKKTTWGAWYLELDGVDDSVSFVDNEAWNLSGNSCYFKMWFLCTVAPTDSWARIFSRYDGTDGFIVAFHTNGTPRFYWREAGVTGISINPTTTRYDDGIWHQLICAVDLPNTNSYMYVDNEEIGSDLSATNQGDAAGPLYIGGAGIVYSYRGGLTKAKICNRFPSSGEISSLWDSERKYFGR